MGLSSAETLTQIINHTKFPSAIKLLIQIFQHNCTGIVSKCDLLSLPTTPLPWLQMFTNISIAMSIVHLAYILLPLSGPGKSSGRNVHMLL